MLWLLVECHPAVVRLIKEAFVHLCCLLLAGHRYSLDSRERRVRVHRCYTHMRGLEDIEKPATVVQASLELALCLFPILVGLLSSLLEDIFRRRVAWKAQANLLQNAQEPT